MLCFLLSSASLLVAVLAAPHHVSEKIGVNPANYVAEGPYIVGVKNQPPTTGGYELMTLEEIKGQAFRDYYNTHKFLNSTSDFSTGCCLFQLKDDMYLGITGTMVTTYTSLGTRTCGDVPNPVAFGGRQEGTGKFVHKFFSTLDSDIVESLTAIPANMTRDFCDAREKTTYALYTNVKDSKYVCDSVSRKCVPDADRGLPLDECKEVCVEPEYHCVDDKCEVTTNKGVDKTTCEEICGKPAFA
eukprot:m.335909 g.335909  ORF g.335909 m.335909 type:complete len:243 (+) comp17705_c0_seq1:166-894(+)